jgi:hypothetical protein
VAVEIVSAEPGTRPGSEAAESVLEVALPAREAPSVLHIEVARGALLSGPKVRTRAADILHWRKKAPMRA